MTARMMNGYWAFRAPVGFKSIRTGGHGKLLHKDEPIASVIKEIYEGYAAGRFDGMAEIMRYLKSHPAWPADKRKTLSVERVMELMSRAHYAGYLHAPEWGIIMLKGKHEPIISLETFEAVQARIKGKSRTFTRYDVNESFPLRGYVTCSDCGHAYSACFSTGRSKRYPYYLCHTKNCASYGRSIRKEVLEGQFEELLRSLRPTPELFELAQEMFRDLWNARMSSETSNVKHLQAEVVRVERQIEQIVDRIIASDMATMVTAFENRVRGLELEKALLAEKIAQCGRPIADFDATHRTAMQFLENPYRIWLSERLCDKRNTVKLAFAEPIPYDRKHGFRTATAAVPFRIFKALEGNEGSASEESEMVRAVGIEPTLLAEPDFESGASTSFTTPARCRTSDATHLRVTGAVYKAAFRKLPAEAASRMCNVIRRLAEKCR